MALGVVLLAPQTAAGRSASFTVLTGGSVVVAAYTSDGSPMGDLGRASIERQIVGNWYPMNIPGNAALPAQLTNLCNEIVINQAGVYSVLKPVTTDLVGFIADS